MRKSTWVGIDVSARTLAVTRARDGTCQQGEFANDPTGHRQLLTWLGTRRRGIRVCLEATGVYGLDLAMTLHAAPGVEVMVANPRAVLRFAQATLRRAKTDPVDANTLCEFVQRMPFRLWTPPPPAVQELRAIARRMESVTMLRTQELNRVHAAAYGHTPDAVRADRDDAVAQCDRRLAQLQAAAQAVIATDPDLASAYAHLCSVKGIAAVSAIHLLAELRVLPGELTARQWVAHAGLDPRPWQSGTSVHKPARISRTGNHHLRRALFMPALVAARHEPQVRAFYQHLLDRGKTRMQAIVAVMRKLLHAIYGMLKHDADFNGLKFYAMAG